MPVDNQSGLNYGCILLELDEYIDYTRDTSIRYF